MYFLNLWWVCGIFIDFLNIQWEARSHDKLNCGHWRMPARKKRNILQREIFRQTHFTSV